MKTHMQDRLLDFTFIVFAILCYKYLVLFIPSKFLNSVYYYLYYYGALMGITFLLILLHILLRKEKLSFHDIHFKFKPEYIAYGLVFMFIISLLGRIVAPNFDSSFYYVSGITGNIFQYIVIVILAAFVEELFYRGVLQSVVQKHYSILLTAIALSLHFSLSHFSWYYMIGAYNNIVQIASIFLASLVLILIYYQTKSIFLTFIVHLSSNLLNLLQIYLHVNYVSYEWIFWFVWALFSAFFMKKALSWFKNGFSFSLGKNVMLVDYLYLAIISLLPIVLYAF